MIELAIDCSKTASMAIACDNGVFCLPSQEFGRSSDRDFLPCLESFLKEHGLSIRDVEGWTIGTGPGSFAGIRFSLALVKGICTVTHAKARGICSSYAIAKIYAEKSSDATVCVLQNARCGKVFASCYSISRGRCSQTSVPAMMEPRDIPMQYNIYCTHDPELQEMLKGTIPSELSIVPPPNAQNLLGAPEQDFPWLDTPDVEPIYVRPPA